MIKESDHFRHYNWIDQAIIRMQDLMHGVVTRSTVASPSPARDLPEPILTKSERRESERLMRVNHTGEVCAQALYEGQLVFASSKEIKALLQKASLEECDHLAWTHERIEELKGHTSYFNFFWYTNAFFIGVMASIAGDAWSLGFVEETERQVTVHLEGHLKKLPEADTKSRKIVEKMREDEMHHGQVAARAGAKELPAPIKKLMSMHAKVMTTLSYWI